MSDNKSITDKLLDLKEKIDAAKGNKARAEGKLEELMDRLKKEHKITSLRQAERELKKMDTDIQALDKELEEGMKELEEEYEF